MPFSAFRFTLRIGALLGLLQFATTLIVYACGLHGSPVDLEAGHKFESLGAFIAIMACLSLGLRRAQRDLHRYGSPFTFGTGARLALGVASAGGLFTAAGQYVYVAFIHPAYSGHLRAALVTGAKLAPDQAEAYAHQLDFAASAVFRALNQGVSTLFFSLLIGCAYALLFRDRSATVTVTVS
jgi:hypothetical protein